jgi:hypothetical protein
VSVTRCRAAAYLACYPEAAETPRGLHSRTSHSHPWHTSNHSLPPPLIVDPSPSARFRMTNSRGDMCTSRAIASPRLVIPRQRRRRGTSHSHPWHASNHSLPPPVDVGSVTVYAVQDDRRREKDACGKTSNPAPDTAFVVEIFLSKLALEIAFLARDDEAIDKDQADGHGEQHPRGIDQNCEPERQ